MTTGVATPSVKDAAHRATLRVLANQAFPDPTQPGRWRVPSAKQAGVAYAVQLNDDGTVKRCTCPAWAYGTRRCVHVDAIRLRLGRRRRRASGDVDAEQGQKEG